METAVRHREWNTGTMTTAATPATRTIQHDEDLVDAALTGDQAALENLLKRYQEWIYNTALRMVGNVEDAKDLTQEVLIKIVTHLGTFEKRSSFRTWLYRIVTNHVLHMKQTARERYMTTFSDYAKLLENTPDEPISLYVATAADQHAIVEETRIECMTGMLLCLDRLHRIVFILGAMYAMTDREGAAILDLSRDNFRQKLCRARKAVRNFMQHHCGVVNGEAACKCPNKAGTLVRTGEINPTQLKYSRGQNPQIKEHIARNSNLIERIYRDKVTPLYREHPFYQGEDFIDGMRKILSSSDFRTAFHLHD